jgi:hypothetical protein
MKNSDKSKFDPKVLKELAAHFEEDISRNLPMVMHEDGTITYKKYAITKTPLETWALYDVDGKTCLGEFFLRTCAIMSAKAYDDRNHIKAFEVKRLDYNYWSSFSNNQIYKINVTRTTESFRHSILLNKLEDSHQKTEFYKSKITNMFKDAFV